MSLKESNEITVKIKCELDEFYKNIEEKGFKVVGEFSIDDTYLIPENVDLKNVKIRDILSKAVIIREFKSKPSGSINSKITFKIKKFDDVGNILNQEAINCSILEKEEARTLLKAIGYKEIMNIKEDDKIYEREDFKFAVKDINNGDNLIEVETDENEGLDTIEKLIQKINELEIPIYTDDYFVKKAEIELGKILEKDNLARINIGD